MDQVCSMNSCIEYQKAEHSEWEAPVSQGPQSRLTLLKNDSLEDLEE